MSSICPRCKHRYDQSEVDCPIDGVGLVPDRAGATLGGCTLTTLIGGSRGDVVWAGNDADGAPVAVRLLGPDPDDARDDDRLRALRRAMRLRHPRIARLLSTGRTPDGTRWVVTERLRGRRLAAVAAAGRLKLVPALHVIDQLLGLLAYAHERGVVHGTLGASRVYIVPDALDPWAVALSGFGLNVRGAPSPDLDGDEARSLLHPRRCYRAPEQVLGHRGVARSDLYAAGVMLFELLTGTVPFEGVAPAEIDRRHLFAIPPPLAMAAPGVWFPAGLDALIRRALAKEPEGRYASAAQMRGALARVIAGADLTSHPAVASGG